MAIAIGRVHGDQRPAALTPGPCARLVGGKIRGIVNRIGMLAEHNPAGMIKAGAHLLGAGPAGLRQTAAARGSGLPGAIAHPVAEGFFGLPDGAPGYQGTQQQHHQRPDDADDGGRRQSGLGPDGADNGPAVGRKIWPRSEQFPFAAAAWPGVAGSRPARRAKIATTSMPSGDPE